VGSFGQFMDLTAWSGQLMSGWSEVGQPSFWVAVLKIMWINILLSGDNAVVIAMACLGLPPRQRLWGMIFGAGVAVLLRIVFTVVVAKLMQLPYLKLVGGLALFYIAAKLLVPEKEDESEVEATQHLWRAIRIVAIADIIMSLDNVIAIAAAAQNNYALIIIGLAISIPLIVVGAALIMALLERYPIFVWAGAALLGWIVGEVMVTDPAVEPFLARYIEGTAMLNFEMKSAAFDWGKTLALHLNLVELAAATLGAILVVLVGGTWRRSKLRERITLPVTAHPVANKKQPAE
jgi:YjbE family integral membrane protein